MSARWRAGHLRPVAVNLLGLVEQPEFGRPPYRVSPTGIPTCPPGTAGSCWASGSASLSLPVTPTTLPRAPAWSTPIRGRGMP